MTFLDLLDALEKNDRILVLNLLFVNNTNFKEPLDEQGFFLHKAGQCIYGSMCEMVINYSLVEIDVNRKNKHGVTPLNMAARFNTDACAMLLKCKADVNSTTDAGFTPLQKAAMHGCCKACRQLCNTEAVNIKGPKVYQTNKEIYVNWQNNDKNTVLDLVIAARDKAIMKSTYIWPYKRWEDRSTKIVKLLIKMGADVNLQNDDGETPLRITARYKIDYIVKLLLHYNADVFFKNKENKVALELTEHNIYEHVKTLIRVNEVNCEGKYQLINMNLKLKVKLKIVKMVSK